MTVRGAWLYLKEIQVSVKLARLDIRVFPPFIPCSYEHPVRIALDRSVQCGAVVCSIVTLFEVSLALRG